MGIRVEVGKQRGAHPRRTKTEDGAHRGDDGGTSATAQHATERTRRTKGWADQEQCAKPGPATRSSGGEPGRSVISGGSPGRKSPRKKSPPTRFYRSLLGIIRRVDPPIRPHPTTGGRSFVANDSGPQEFRPDRRFLRPRRRRKGRRSSPHPRGRLRRSREGFADVAAAAPPSNVVAEEIGLLMSQGGNNPKKYRVTDVPRWQ